MMELPDMGEPRNARMAEAFFEHMLDVVPWFAMDHVPVLDEGDLIFAIEDANPEDDDAPCTAVLLIPDHANRRMWRRELPAFVIDEDVPATTFAALARRSIYANWN